MRLPLRLLVALSCGLAASANWAQAPLDGAWRVTFSTEGADGREAQVEIRGQSGTWTTYARSDKDKRDPCVGRALPLTLSGGDGASSALQLRVEASSVVSGCRDRKATLQRVDEKTLEGSFDNGRPLRLVRP
ncbi:hypothetical protein [Hydrogenophaga sp.]|uniref:hypothetical protein n=1 Tax=Hydrogenophaga sp. TaxID=1904254 RepID=UPI002630F9D9|nr:hypothetical protein [Hydrogenophaga sp.]MCW5654514.1 hypothetical protein [Hydrogenophaga sp.]